MKILKKLSVYWNLLGVHELLCIAAFLFSLWVLTGVLTGRI